jgi:hypothetical protein
LQDFIAVFLHPLDHEVEIMDGSEGHADHFPCFEQMVDIGERETLTGQTVASFFNGRKLVAVA